VEVEKSKKKLQYSENPISEVRLPESPIEKKRNNIHKDIRCGADN